MLSKKMKTMVAVVSLVTSPLTIQAINPVLAYAETMNENLIDEKSELEVENLTENGIQSLSEVGVITMNDNCQDVVYLGYLSTNLSTSETVYSPMVSIPKGATEASFRTEKWYTKFKGTNVRFILYYEDFDSNGVEIPTHTSVHGEELSSSTLVYQYTSGVGWNLYPEHSYRFKLSVSNGMGQLVLGDSYVTYTPEIHKFVENILTSSKTRNLSTQSNINSFKQIVTKAQKSISSLSVGDDRDSLQEKLDSVTQTINLAQAKLDVEKAESSRLQSDLDIAQEVINKLKDCQEKTDLQERVNTLQTIINSNETRIVFATEAVILAENLQNPDDIEKANSLINELSNTPDKYKLQNRITNLSINMAIQKVETTHSKEDYNAAKELVSKLTNGAVKISFEDRLKVIETEINSIDTDTTAPNTPSIIVSENKVTIHSIDIINEGPTSVDLLDGFEASNYENPIGGDWVRTTLQSKTGSYSLGSSNIGKHSTTSSGNLKFKVPEGLSAELSFDYLVKSEANYDKLIITLNGTQIINVSGNGSWLNYKKTLTSGDYTLEFKYQKDSSGNTNSDMGFIDNLRVKGYIESTSLPSGIKEIQYQINDGAWTNYKDGFTPNASGKVTINARAIDYAGNISEVSTKTVSIQNNSLEIAKENVGILEDLSKDLTTQDKIDEANKIYDDLVNTIPKIENEVEKEAINNKLESLDKVIKEAQLILDAKSGVSELEGLSSDLSNQTLVDNANEKLREVSEIVNSLEDGALKTDLTNRINSVKEQIDTAQATINITVAQNSVVELENLSKDLSNQTLVDEFNTKLEETMSIIESLQDEEVKSELTDRVNTIKGTVSIAQSEIYVATAESSLSQTDLDNALKSVQDLEDGGVKEVLMNRINEVQYKIDLNVATESVVLAESTITQESIDSSKVLISELREEDKAKLTERLNAVQNIVDVKTLVQTIEETSLDLSTQEQINNIKTEIEKATIMVNDIQNEELKTELLSKIESVNVKVIESQAKVDVANLETNITNENLEIAKNSIDKVQDETLKAELTERVQSVENVLSVYNESETIIDEYKEILSDVRYTSLKDIFTNKFADTNKELDELNIKATNTLEKINSLPSGTTEMAAKKQEAINNIKKVQTNIVALKKVLKLVIIPIDLLEKLHIQK